jgi:perosamine synthetase
MEVNKAHPLVSVGDSIRDAIEIVDRFAKKTCYVLEGRKLVGLATDGDIRRALLDGALLDDKIESAMNRDFVSFPYSTESKIIRERFSSKIRFIPLVDESGELVDIADPLGNYRISILEPHLQGNELNYVSDCIKTNWISSQGKYVSQFEGIFEDLHSGMHALAVSNGSVALHLALVALGLEEGDEVIVPNITFAASANSVIHAGAVPVFCEIDPKTWCINPEEAKKLISSRTRAIMPVHLYGQPCDLSALKNLCVQNKLLMIEDCAEALGSKWQGSRVGTFGDASTFSFFGNKTISTGEGGMVLFRDEKIYLQAKILRDHGMSEDKRYWHEFVGYNYRLTNLQASVGVAQMERFEAIIEKKIKIFEIYEESFSDVAGISRIPEKVEQTLHSNWLYGVVLDDNLDRDLIMDELLEYGIETRPFFYPLHNMNPYKNYRTSQEIINSEKISLQGLSLPSSVNLSTSKLNFIIQTFLKVIGEKIN